MVLNNTTMEKKVLVLHGCDFLGEEFVRYVSVDADKVSKEIAFIKECWTDIYEIEAFPLLESNV